MIPKDWGNATVYDPFLADVTAQCLIQTGRITIPQSVLNRLGWWQIALQAPNYASSLVIQKYDFATYEWLNSTSFRVGNTTRASISIERGSSFPAVVNYVNATWALPNGTPWSLEKLGPSTNGTVRTSSHVIDASASGNWELTVAWTNGTEVAYADSHFVVYHRATIAPIYPLIETEDGQVVAEVLRYADAETGEYLTDDSATVAANWSVAKVTFVPNLAKKWWEADLNTSLIAPGAHIVRVNASMAYFDNSWCAFVVRSYIRTRLTSPNVPWTNSGWNQTSALTFLFEAYNHASGLWIPVTNTSGDILLYTNWSLGAWRAEESSTSGVYAVFIDTGALPAGNWVLNITIAKSNYQTGHALLTLIVSRPLIKAAVDGTGPHSVLRVGKATSFTLRYHVLNGTTGISGATVLSFR